MYSDVLIESLPRLRNRLAQQPIPSEVMQQAIRQNPWFSPAACEMALANICRWLTADDLRGLYLLSSFFDVHAQKTTNNVPTVGVIAAGNVPFVGFHDVLIPILAGCKVFLKPSHQDAVLLPWLLEMWQAEYPLLAERVALVERISPDVQLLIATGSNNTARYMEAMYAQTRRVIRKNRFSAAVLTPETPPAEWALLAEDILSYNGLGCRNVSNVLLVGDASVAKLAETLREYPTARLNGLYLQKVARERAIYSLTNTPYVDATVALLLPSETLQYAQMGIIYTICVPTLAAARSLLHQSEAQLQCMVGIDTPFGSTQCPDLNRFADDVNTFDLCLSLHR